MICGGNMNQVTFTAGYGDPTRTIRQKYSDYGKIDDLISRLRNENSLLEENLSQLEVQRTSLVTKFQNITGLDKTKIQEEIQNLTQKIDSIKNKMEENRDTIRKSWYGFHERL